MADDLYSKFGASASKAGMKGALARAGLKLEKKLFAPVIDDLAGSPSHASFVHCDGAGTKSIVAYLDYKTTGRPDSFAGIAQDALVMNLDDIFCIGVPETMVLANLIARNAHRVGDEVIETIVGSYRSLIEKLRGIGINLTMSGGETADCGDTVQTILVDAVVAGRIRRSGLIEAGGLRPGDVILGLSSTGQTTYEDRPNSGIGSNGLTLARNVLLTRDYLTEFPEISSDGAKGNGYLGNYTITDRPTALDMSVGEALSSPTRTYAPVLARIYSELGSAVHSVIHNTGGGQTKVLGFAGNVRIVKDNLFPTPPLFELIQQEGNVPWKEMFTVFNMGHRMEMYLPEDAVPAARRICEDFHLDSRVVGRVELASSAELVIDAGAETFGFAP